jgi:type I restriction enzyme S subunit
MEFAVKEGLFSSRANQSTIEHVTVEKLSNQKIPVPPAEEQRKIAQELSKSMEKIESILDSLDSVKELLEEKRQALIKAAVTGQIDVTGTQSTELETAT